MTDELTLAADFPQATYEDWRKLVDGVLKGAPFEKLVGKTSDGLKIDPIYRRAQRRRAGRRPCRGSALADHAADRSSRCKSGQRAGAARSRERRDGTDTGVRRRQWRPWFRAAILRRRRSRRFSTAFISTPGSASSFRSARSRGWPPFTSPNISSAKASIPPPAISASGSTRSAPARCGAPVPTAGRRSCPPSPARSKASPRWASRARSPPPMDG